MNISTRLCIASVLTLLTLPGSSIAQENRLTGQGSEMWHQDVEGVYMAVAEEGDRLGEALTWGDFNGDGTPDLAVGVPGEAIGSVQNAGAVHIFYGGDDLKLTTTVQIFDQGNNAIEGAAEAGDQFGSALAAGDLNGDGYDDLAIGVPGEDVGDVANAGAVAVLFGKENGILATDNQLWYEGSRSFDPGGEAGKNHQFGSSLAVGDFYGNGQTRLVIGIPGAEIENKQEAGAVGVVFPTTNNGWSLARVLHRGKGRIRGSATQAERFGHALTVGDFNNDGRDDLAIGNPNSVVSKEYDAGSVMVVFGGRDGIIETSGNVVLSQVAYGIEGAPESGDLFGWVLATGDFDADGYDDLAVGIPGEDIGDIREAGAVQVLHGHESTTKLGAENKIWHQNNINMQAVLDETKKPKAGDLRERLKTRGQVDVPTDLRRPAKDLKPRFQSDPAERDDMFGTAIAAADFDLDGFADLAIGVPKEDAGDANSIQGTGIQIGIVQVLYGSDEGLSTGSAQLLSQDSPGAPGAAESGDRFGSSLAATTMRLAVGTPNEAIGDKKAAGAVSVFYSSVLNDQ